MDVDGGAVNTQQTELEQSLLQEFSRMGTTDKEDLINQMQKLLGPSLNYTTASFFLDMNNWNLQEAACCYLDMQPTSVVAQSSQLVALPVPCPAPSPAPCLLSMAVDNQSIVWHSDPLGMPSLEWRLIVRNNGDLRWPEGCRVMMMRAHGLDTPLPMGMAPSVHVEPLQPQQTTELVISFTRPISTEPNVSALYRLITPQGDAFGDELWLKDFATKAVEVDVSMVDSL